MSAGSVMRQIVFYDRSLLRSHSCILQKSRAFWLAGALLVNPIVSVMLEASEFAVIDYRRLVDEVEDNSSSAYWTATDREQFQKIKEMLCRRGGSWGELRYVLVPQILGEGFFGETPADEQETGEPQLGEQPAEALGKSVEAYPEPQHTTSGTGNHRSPSTNAAQRDPLYIWGVFEFTGQAGACSQHTEHRGVDASFPTPGLVRTVGTISDHRLFWVSLLTKERRASANSVTAKDVLLLSQQDLVAIGTLLRWNSGSLGSHVQLETIRALRSTFEGDGGLPWFLRPLHEDHLVLLTGSDPPKADRVRGYSLVSAEAESGSFFELETNVRDLIGEILQALDSQDVPLSLRIRLQPIEGEGMGEVDYFEVWRHLTFHLQTSGREYRLLLSEQELDGDLRAGWFLANVAPAGLGAEKMVVRIGHEDFSISHDRRLPERQIEIPVEDLLQQVEGKPSGIHLTLKVGKNRRVDGVEAEGAWHQTLRLGTLELPLPVEEWQSAHDRERQRRSRSDRPIPKFSMIAENPQEYLETARRSFVRRTTRLGPDKQDRLVRELEIANRRLRAVSSRIARVLNLSGQKFEVLIVRGGGERQGLLRQVNTSRRQSGYVKWYLEQKLGAEVSVVELERSPSGAALGEKPRSDVIHIYLVPPPTG